MPELSGLAEIINQNDLMRNVISTVILILAVVGLRIFLSRTIQKWPIRNPEMRRRWIVQAKNTSFLVLLMGLAFLWGPELKTVAVSIIAIAAALVIATKELILCVLGGLMKAATQMFSIGDRIEIQGLRGDVIDHNLVTTTLFEVGPSREFHHFTGRVVRLPNALFLTQALVNETETGNYVLHVFRLSFNRKEDWQKARNDLLRIARKACEPYIGKARQQFDRLARKEGLESPNVEPRVSISYAEPERVDLLVRIPVPNTGKGRLEQAIINEFAGLETNGSA
jgi:small-conductance mechanosensitive channel